MEKMDETLQQAKVMEDTCTKYAATETKDGINADQIQLLQSQYEDASAKNTAQQAAVAKVGDLTTQQQFLLNNGSALVQKFREAAKGEYGENDKAKMSEFHVGKMVPRTVKGLTSELKYMKSVATAHKADLLKHGVKDADIELLGTLADELSSIDSQQENAKKVQKAATRDRNDSMKELRRTIRKIQHSAKSIFSKEPLLIIEFESITNGRGPSGKGDIPPEEPKE